MSRNSNYDKYPFIPVSNSRAECWVGWQEIVQRLAGAVDQRRVVLSVECYPGAFEREIRKVLEDGLRPLEVISTSCLLKPARDVDRMLKGVLGDDPVFGSMNDISLGAFFDASQLDDARQKAAGWQTGLLLVVGTGTTLVFSEPDVLVYADMARWAIQCRQRRNEIRLRQLHRECRPEVQARLLCGLARRRSAQADAVRQNRFLP
jgi:hypothetical protein